MKYKCIFLKFHEFLFRKGDLGIIFYVNNIVPRFLAFIKYLTYVFILSPSHKRTSIYMSFINFRIDKNHFENGLQNLRKQTPRKFEIMGQNQNLIDPHTKPTST